MIIVDARNTYFLSRAEMVNENSRLSGVTAMRATPEEKDNLERLNKTFAAAEKGF